MIRRWLLRWLAFDLLREYQKLESDCAYVTRQLAESDRRLRERDDRIAAGSVENARQAEHIRRLALELKDARALRVVR